MKTLIPLLILGLLLAPLGVAHAGNGKGKGKGKAKGAANASSASAHNGTGNGKTPNANSNSTKTNNSWRRVWARGGIDPATFPVIDDDLLFMVTQTDWQIGRSKAHRLATGAGLLIAVLDGGFTRHPLLEGHWHRRSYDTVGNDWDAFDEGNGFDDDGDGHVDNALGHGTFVAGQIAWVAPDARILPIRVRDDEGWGTTDELMRGLLMAWYIGADVVNLSLSEEAANAPHILDLIDMLHADGVAVVVSAGNEGSDQVSELGMRRTALTVAAVDKDDRLAPFSNFGVAGDPLLICAPGVDLYGPMAGGEGYWSGTSFAAGIVSGGIALMLQRNPGLPIDLVYMLLQMTADRAYDEAGRPLPAGRINLVRATK